MQAIKPRLLALTAASLITAGEIVAFAINTHPPLRASEMDAGSAQAAAGPVARTTTPFLRWKSI
jgi:hypothetical protein